MANVISPSLKDKYLEELAVDERTIHEAAEAYEYAKARLDVGLRRYTALRDFVAEQVGQSPYMKGFSWPNDDYTGARGRYRFTGMSLGDAILEILTEEAWEYPDQPQLMLSAIVERLSRGGYGFPDPVQGRAVNAALLKTSGIRKEYSSDGFRLYSLEQLPSTEEDDEDE